MCALIFSSSDGNNSNEVLSCEVSPLCDRSYFRDDREREVGKTLRGGGGRLRAVLHIKGARIVPVINRGAGPGRLMDLI